MVFKQLTGLIRNNLSRQLYIFALPPPGSCDGRPAVFLAWVLQILTVLVYCTRLVPPAAKAGIPG